MPPGSPISFEIVEPLRDGRLCITSIVQLAKVLTPENCHDVLPKFFQRSKREAMAVAAELQPEIAAPHREVVTAWHATTQPLLAGAAATSKSNSHTEPAFQPVEIPASSSSPLTGTGSNSTDAPPIPPVVRPV